MHSHENKKNEEFFIWTCVIPPFVINRQCTIHKLVAIEPNKLRGNFKITPDKRLILDEENKRRKYPVDDYVHVLFQVPTSHVIQDTLHASDDFAIINPNMFTDVNFENTSSIEKEARLIYYIDEKRKLCPISQLKCNIERGFHLGPIIHDMRSADEICKSCGITSRRSQQVDEIDTNSYHFPFSEEYERIVLSNINPTSNEAGSILYNKDQESIALATLDIDDACDHDLTHDAMQKRKKIKPEDRMTKKKFKKRRKKRLVLDQNTEDRNCIMDDDDYNDVIYNHERSKEKSCNEEETSVIVHSKNRKRARDKNGECSIKKKRKKLRKCQKTQNETFCVVTDKSESNPPLPQESESLNVSENATEDTQNVENRSIQESSSKLNKELVKLKRKEARLLLKSEKKERRKIIKNKLLSKNNKSKRKKSKSFGAYETLQNVETYFDKRTKQKLRQKFEQNALLLKQGCITAKDGSYVRLSAAVTNRLCDESNKTHDADISSSSRLERDDDLINHKSENLISNDDDNINHNTSRGKHFKKSSQQTLVQVSGLVTKTTSLYNPCHHFAEYVRDIQGKGKNIPQNILDKVREYMESHQYTDEYMSTQTYRTVLREVGHPEYYNKIPKIRNQLWNRPAIAFTDDQIVTILESYANIVKQWPKDRKGRTSMLKCSMNLYQICKAYDIPYERDLPALVNVKKFNHQQEDYSHLWQYNHQSDDDDDNDNIDDIDISDHDQPIIDNNENLQDQENDCDHDQEKQASVINSCDAYQDSRKDVKIKTTKFIDQYCTNILRDIQIQNVQNESTNDNDSNLLSLSKTSLFKMKTPTHYKQNYFRVLITVI